MGSGGRETGKRLADKLGVPCCDRQIIDIIAQKNADKNYVAHVSEKDVRVLHPSAVGKHIIAPNCIGHQSVQILAEQKKLIGELTAQGDCVIVGRSLRIRRFDCLRGCCRAGIALSRCL